MSGIVSKRRNIFTSASQGSGGGGVSSLTDASLSGVSLIENSTGVLRTLLQGTNISIVDNGDGTISISSIADDITVVANYSALPAANTVSGQFYWCSVSQGTAWLPGSLGGTYYSAGLYYSNGSTWEFMAVPYQATQSEVDAGTNNDKFVTPNTLFNSSKWNSVGGLKSGIATAAVTDVYTTTITGVTSYTTNDAYVIKFNTENSDGATLNINGLGAKNLYKNNDVKITGGDIRVGQEFIIIYDGTNFQMIGIAPNQMFAFVTNADSVTITKGQPVYAFGASGDRMSVKLANNTAEATSSKTVGLVFSTSIAPNGTGFVLTQGVLQNINTAAFNAGDTLYVGATAGTLTNTMPYAPNHLTRIGIVERANAGNGQIYVTVQNGFQLDELSDVDITSTLPVNNDVLTYITGTNNLWKPRSITTILGYTPVPQTRTLTINGTALDLSADRSWTVSSGITVGTTTISSGTSGRIPFNNGGVYGEDSGITYSSANKRLTLGGTTGVIPLIARNSTWSTNFQVTQNNGRNSGAIGFFNDAGTSAMRMSILYRTEFSIMDDNTGNFNVLFYPTYNRLDQSTSIKTGGVPTAYLHLAAQTTSANTGPIKLTDSGGVLMATPENGVFELSNNVLYFTVSGTRKVVTLV